MRVILLVVAALLVVPLSGCLSSLGATRDAAPVSTLSATGGTPFPDEASFLVNGTDGKPLPWSLTVEQGAYKILAPKVLDVPSFDGTKLHIGLFMPDVPSGTKVPVLMDVGPYYAEADDDVGIPAHVRLGKFLIENFVPHGFAVVQASVRGTGESAGCGDYFGTSEMRDLDSLVTFLGEAPWSSGQVGIIGKSYDGTTAWLAAATGNKYLKTIVPIEGIDSIHNLHFHNGSAEPRSLILGALYSTYAVSPGPGSSDPVAPGAPASPAGGAPPSPNPACTSSPMHAPEGAYGYATGGGHAVGMGPLEEYWTQRDFRDRVLKNYHGSVFIVHGFQDWNVKPNQGIDIYNELKGTKKLLVGEWAHEHADRASEHPDVRMDWAEMLLRWFDQELKGVPTDTGPGVILEDTHGNWRGEPANAFPPLDANWLALHPTEDGKLVATGSKGSGELFAPMAALIVPVPDAATKTLLVFKTEPFPAETRISGAPQLHVTVTPRAPGGSLWAELHEITAAGKDIWIGRAQMNLDYANGGASPTPVTPNVPIVAKMEFYPLDARLLAGSVLKLVITQEAGGSDTLPRPETAPMLVQYGDNTTSLKLPIVERPFVATRWDNELDISSKSGGGASTGAAIAELLALGLRAS